MILCWHLEFKSTSLRDNYETMKYRQMIADKYLKTRKKDSFHRLKSEIILDSLSHINRIIFKTARNRILIQ